MHFSINDGRHLKKLKERIMKTRQKNIAPKNVLAPDFSSSGRATATLNLIRLMAIGFAAAALVSCDESSRVLPVGDRVDTGRAARAVDHISVDGKKYNEADEIVVSNEAIRINFRTIDGAGLDGLVEIKEVAIDGVSIPGCRGLNQCLQAGVDVESRSPLVLIINPKAFLRSLRMTVLSAGQQLTIVVRRPEPVIVTVLPPVVAPIVIKPEPAPPSYNSGYGAGFTDGAASVPYPTEANDLKSDYQDGFKAGHAAGAASAARSLASLNGKDSVSFTFDRANVTPPSSSMTRATFLLHSSALVTLSDRLCYQDKYSQFNKATAGDSSSRCVSDQDQPITVERLPDPSSKEPSQDWLISVPMKTVSNRLSLGTRPVLDPGSIRFTNTISGEPTTNRFPVEAVSGANQITVCGDHNFDETLHNVTNRENMSFVNFLRPQGPLRDWPWYPTLGASGGFCVDKDCRDALDLTVDKTIANANYLIGHFFDKTPDIDLGAGLESQFCFHKPRADSGDIVAIDSEAKHRRVEAYAISYGMGSWSQNAEACSLLNTGRYAAEMLPANTHWEMINYSNLKESPGDEQILRGKESASSRLHSLSFLSETVTVSDLNAFEYSYNFLRTNFFAAGFPGVSDLKVDSLESTSDFFGISVAPIEVVSNNLVSISPQNRMKNGMDAGDSSVKLEVKKISKQTVMQGLCVALRPDDLSSSGIIGSLEPVKSAGPAGGRLTMTMTKESPSADMSTLKLYKDETCSQEVSSSPATISVDPSGESATISVVPEDSQRYYAKTSDPTASCQFITKAFLFTPCQTAQEILATVGAGQGECVHDNHGHPAGETASTPEKELQAVPSDDYYQYGQRPHTQVLFSGLKMTYDDAVDFCWNSTAMGFHDWALQGGLGQNSSWFNDDDLSYIETGTPTKMVFNPNTNTVAFDDVRGSYLENGKRFDDGSDNNMGYYGDGFLSGSENFYGTYQSYFSNDGSLISTEISPKGAIQTDANGYVYSIDSHDIWIKGPSSSSFSKIYTTNDTIDFPTPIKQEGLVGLLFLSQATGAVEIISVSPAGAFSDTDPQVDVNVLIGQPTDCYLSGLAANNTKLLISVKTPCEWGAVHLDELGVVTTGEVATVENVPTTLFHLEPNERPASYSIDKRQLIGAGDTFYFEAPLPPNTKDYWFHIQHYEGHIFKLDQDDMEPTLVSRAPGLILPLRPLLAIDNDGNLMTAGQFRAPGAPATDDYFGSLTLKAEGWEHRGPYMSTDKKTVDSFYGWALPMIGYSLQASYFWEPKVSAEFNLFGALMLPPPIFSAIEAPIPTAWVSQSAYNPYDMAMSFRRLSLPIFLNGDKQGRDPRSDDVGSVVALSLFTDRLDEETQTVMCVRKRNSATTFRGPTVVRDSSLP